MSGSLTQEPVTGGTRTPASSPATGANPWMVALGGLAGLLVLAGVIAVAVSLNTIGDFGGTVLGQDQRFDAAVATAIAGGAAIVLGVVVGAAWLVLGAVRFRRDR